jgi:hypothetical protein
MPGDLPTNCVPGAWVTKRMYQSHAKDEAARRALPFDDLDELGRAMSALTMESGPNQHVDALGHLTTKLSDHASAPDTHLTETTASPLLMSDDKAREILQSLQDLQDLQTNLRQLCLTFSPPRRLIFCRIPKTSGTYNTPSDFISVNGGTHALKPSVENRSFLEHENTLTGMLLQIDQVEAFGDQRIRDLRKQLIHRIGIELERLDQFKEVEWVKQQTEDTGINEGVVNTGMVIVTTIQ